MNALTRSLPGARRGDPGRLHQARIATRRLREALPLVMPGSRGRKLERTIRRLTRALGPVRELDVALETLGALTASGDVPRAAIAALRRLLRQERQRLHAEMCTRVDRIDLHKLQRRAVAAASKGHAKAARGRVRDSKRAEAVRLRTARRAVRLREAIENAAGLYLPDRLHGVRVAVKRLRYTTEMSRALGGSRGNARIRILKEAQDLLGHMHDHEVLSARVRALQGSSKAPNLRTSADLDRLVRHLETECRQIHGRYVVLRRKLLAGCDRAAATAATAAGAAAQRPSDA